MLLGTKPALGSEAFPGVGGPVPVYPAWLEAPDGRRYQEAADQILAALSLLAETPTGRDLTSLLGRSGARLRLNSQGTLYASDAENAVVASLEFLEGRAPWQLAVFLAHELEHLRQRALGVCGEAARGTRELGAFLVQSRVWAELGAPTEPEAWAANADGSRDMAAWLEYPWAAMAALQLRSGYSLDLSDKEVESYWTAVLVEDAAWREERRDRFSLKRDAAGSALFVLEQAARSAGAQRASAWLPQVLQQAGRLAPGEQVSLPAPPSAADQAVLAAFPGGLLLAERDGVWSVLRPM